MLKDANASMLGEPILLSRKISRRKYLKYVSAGVVAAAAVTAGAYYSSIPSSSPAQSETSTIAYECDRGIEYMPVSTETVPFPKNITFTDIDGTKLFRIEM